MSNLLSVFGKGNYNTGNYKHKIEKNVFHEHTYLVTIHKYALKKSATNVVVSYLLPSKGKVL